MPSEVGEWTQQPELSVEETDSFHNASVDGCQGNAADREGLGVVVERPVVL